MSETQFVFPTLVFGPRAAGRGYERLAASSLPELSAGAQDILESLPLALAGWADSGERRFAACVPLGDVTAPVLLLRACFAGAGAGGSIAYANAVLVDRPLPHSALLALLARIPSPDGSTDFAAAPFRWSEEAVANRFPHDWQGLGLAWADRLLLVSEGTDEEQVLISALGSIDPVEQRRRVRGWATTAALLATGSFVPARAFQLVATAAGAAAAPGLPHLLAAVTADGFDGPKVEPPAAWDCWREVTALADGDSELAATVRAAAWRPAYAGMAAGALAEATLAALVGRIPPTTALRLLERGAASPNPIVSQSASKTFDRLVADLPLADLAEIAAAWMNLEIEGGSHLPNLAPLMLSRDDVGGLPPEVLAHFLLEQPGLADAVVRALPAATLRALAAPLIEAERCAGEEALLVATLVELIAHDGDDEAASYFAAGLGRALGWTDLPAVRSRLIEPQIASTVRRVSAGLAVSYASKVLLVRKAVETADPQQLTVALSALLWLRDRRGADAQL